MLILLSISLSLDAFVVALAHGLKSTRIPFLSKLIICFISIFYFGISVFMGEYISSFFSPQTAKIIGILLMSFLCIWMLLQVIFNKDTKCEDNNNTSSVLFKWTFKSIRLTFAIIKNPMLCDVDKSNSISPAEAFFLGTTLSIDSISIGMGYALLGNVSFFAPLMVGLFQLVFLCSGNFIGLKFQSLKLKHTDKLQLVSVSIMFLLLIVRIFA